MEIAELGLDIGLIIWQFHREIYDLQGQYVAEDRGKARYGQQDEDHREDAADPTFKPGDQPSQKKCHQPGQRDGDADLLPDRQHSDDRA